MRGKVKYWHVAKKFGFIIPDDGAADIFFHVNESPRLIDVRLGMRVEYSRAQGRDGKQQAVDVEVVN